VPTTNPNTIQIRVTEDELIAWISIQAESGNYPSLSDITNALFNANVVSGFDQDQLRKIAEGRKPINDFPIARTLPENINPANFIFWQMPAFTPVTTEPETPAARVDFKNIKSFHPVKKDQTLISVNPFHAESLYTTVTGKTLNLAKSNLLHKAGRNTRISDDGRNLLADIDGMAIFEDGVINVDNVYHVSGSVNYNTGNIKFDGSVIIDGDVRSGFRVEAKDDIFIAGNVEAALIYSQNGNISIQCGIVGKGKAKILAGGNLICGFIQDATIGVRKDISAVHYIINSNITAGGHVLVYRNEGLVRGGVIMAEKGIDAIDIGSVKNMHTEIKLRNHSTNENQNRLWELSKIRAEIQMRHSLLERQLSFLTLIEERQGELSEQKSNEKKFVTDELNRLRLKLEEHNKTEISLQQEAAKERLAKEIIVRGALFPNVHIDIGGLSFYNDKKLEGVKILRFKNDIIVESINELDHHTYDIFVQG
jgi:uncharacterized protein (DUF342 family)